MLKNSFLFDFIRILQIFIKLFDNDFCSSLLIELAKRFTKPKDNLVNTILFSTIRGFLIIRHSQIKCLETIHPFKPNYISPDIIRLILSRKPISRINYDINIKKEDRRDLLH